MWKLRHPNPFRLWPAIALALCLLAVAPPVALAEDDEDPFEELVFDPELVMANQRKIELTREQRDLFIREMQATQTDVLPVEFEMTEASMDLIELLEGPRVDEEAALEAAARVLELERQVKSRHMVLLIRIKNLLTEEQQELLQEIREEDD